MGYSRDTAQTNTEGSYFLVFTHFLPEHVGLGVGEGVGGDVAVGKWSASVVRGESKWKDINRNIYSRYFWRSREPKLMFSHIKHSDENIYIQAARYYWGWSHRRTWRAGDIAVSYTHLTLPTIA